ncbi:hypothetical protein [Azospirillum sp. Marseille-Q6669]
MNLGVVINFCTNEKRFINACINSVSKIAKQIVVPVSDHFFDGEPEDLDLVKRIANANSDAEFTVYNAQNQYQPRPGIYSRALGVSKLRSEIDWVLFLDCDEIVDTDIFSLYLEKGDWRNYDTIALSNYWYFRDPTIRAKTLETSAVLIRREFVRIDPADQSGDRQQVHQYVKGRQVRNVTHEGQVMIHHFSWVRSKDEMLKKVISWGHKGERDWVSSVEEEFSRPFNGTCFVNDYTFDIVENKFNL